MKKKIYVASSWRNEKQQEVVRYLRSRGHEVYDFKNPFPGDNGFGWRDINPNWENWTNEEYIEALQHPLAESGFNSDFEAMNWADIFVLVLPCGRSAHLELGWACGSGRETYILLDHMEPELMVKMCTAISEKIEDIADMIESD